ncbi:type II secretion system protein, partial [Calidithermus chliarophilus]|uniref:type II secretion system protein n=1 Tax=Calidithermus chliarophilus TaxID=52023 RepID=UPI00055D19E9
MTRRRLGFTLVEVLVAAGLVALVGTYLGRLANAGREAVQQSEGQSQAAQILARLGGEAQRGNPRVVPPGGTRLL